MSERFDRNLFFSSIIDLVENDEMRGDIDALKESMRRFPRILTQHGCAAMLPGEYVPLWKCLSAAAAPNAVSVMMRKMLRDRGVFLNANAKGGRNQAAAK